MDWLAPLVSTVVIASTPLVIAALGELVVERAGVLNLGVEGMMIVGAVAAFAAAVASGSAVVGFGAGALAGGAMAGLFALMVLVLRTSQVPTGLALTLFGIGLSALAGAGLIGETLPSAPRGVPGLEQLPVVGKMIFGHDVIVYAAVALVAAVSWFLFRTRLGLIVRAVGEDHAAAHALGYPVLAVRCGCILFGGLMAGVAGAYLSVIYTPLWTEGMTAGRGWIALALVVFASWRPWWCLLGALLFGSFSIFQFYLQGSSLAIAGQYYAMLPYLVTIVVLSWTSWYKGSSLGAPACLGKPFGG